MSWGWTQAQTPLQSSSSSTSIQLQIPPVACDPLVHTFPGPTMAPAASSSSSQFFLSRIADEGVGESLPMDVERVYSCHLGDLTSSCRMTSSQGYTSTLTCQQADRELLCLSCEEPSCTLECVPSRTWSSLLANLTSNGGPGLFVCRSFNVTAASLDTWLWSEEDAPGSNLSATSNETLLLVPPEEPPVSWAFLLVLVFILGGGLGNGLVCLTVCTERRLQTVTNYFLVSLALADLLVSVFVMPYGAVYGFLGYWPFGAVWCNVYVTCDVLACSASILHMCCISLGRYLGVRNPLRTRTRRESRRRCVALQIALVWFLALAISSLITALGLADPENIVPAPRQCAINNRAFFLAGSLLAFYIPMLIMGVSYALTVHLLRKAAFAQEATSRAPDGTIRRTLGGRYSSSRKLTPTAETYLSGSSSQKYLPWATPLSAAHFAAYMNGNSANTPGPPPPPPRCEQATQTGEGGMLVLRPGLLRRTRFSIRALPPRDQPQLAAHVVATERKASKVLGLVFLCFVICWAPFFVLNILLAVCPDCEVPERLGAVCLWLGYVSSTINPLIYTAFNRAFRTAFLRRLRCCFCCCLRTPSTPQRTQHPWARATRDTSATSLVASRSINRLAAAATASSIASPNYASSSFDTHDGSSDGC